LGRRVDVDLVVAVNQLDVVEMVALVVTDSAKARSWPLR
jgi:hypothetical protein